MSIALTHVEGQAIAVFGLARSGQATVRAALAGGAQSVFAWDDGDEPREGAKALGASVAEPATWPWADLSTLVLAPGVPLTYPQPHPVVDLARKAELEVVCDIELLYRQMAGKARFVAITGTNGKSTTTALIGHVLRTSGINAAIGGNIGVAALDLDCRGDDPVFVLEMSSFQLDLTASFRPDIAVWLNLTPDHLDRHGDLAGYRRAKQRIFANMHSGDLAVIGIDDTDSEQVAGDLAVRADAPEIRSVSVNHHIGADYYVNAAGMLNVAGRTREICCFPSLRGQHNWQNAACAAAVSRAFDIDDAGIDSAMQSFPGLAHRMEIIGHRDRVLFVNDSKATNADAAGRALSAFAPIYWIAGGRSEDGSITALQNQFGRIAKAYLIGEAAAGFSADLAGRVPHVIAGDINSAVKMAAADAALDGRPEPVVLLSPACKSFDQFADFAARGEAFRAAFQAIDQNGLNEETLT